MENFRICSILHYDPDFKGTVLPLGVLSSSPHSLLLSVAGLHPFEVVPPALGNPLSNNILLRTVPIYILFRAGSR